MFYILMGYNTLLHMTGFTEQVAFDYKKDFLSFNLMPIWDRCPDLKFTVLKTLINFSFAMLALLKSLFLLIALFGG